MVVESPFSAVGKGVSFVLANDEEFAAECDSDKSCCVFLFHRVVLFPGVFLKNGPLLRDLGIISAGPGGPPLPPPLGS